jgi:hypothetical protein
MGGFALGGLGGSCSEGSLTGLGGRASSRVEAWEWVGLGPLEVDGAASGGRGEILG